MLADHFAPDLNRYQAFPDARLLDVTLRDGSFAVGFRWDRPSIFRIVGSLARARIPFVELGYLGGVPELHHVQDAGITADFPLALVAELAERFPETNLALMVHPGALRRELDYREIRQAGISLLRFVFHPSWGEKLKQSIASAQEVGLSTTVNIALATRYVPASLLALCRELGEAHPSAVYLADTCSAFYPHQVQELIRVLAPEFPGSLGFHAHDFLSLAFANTLAAAGAGANFIDVSLAGIGRGAGNLAAELWCVAAVAQECGRYDVEALLDGLEVVRCWTPARQSDVVALVCGACNLTPPEEDLLRQTAEGAGVDAAVLACRYAMRRGLLPRLSREGLLALITGE